MSSSINSFYDKILNISDKNIEDEIEKIVAKYRYIDSEGMCKVLSRQIYYDLLNKHISRQLINTKSLGLSYEHEFLVCNSQINGKIILIDLAFKQFLRNKNKILLNFKEWPSDILGRSEIGIKILSDLINYGYTTVDYNGLKLYLSSIANGELIDDLPLIK